MEMQISLDDIELELLKYLADVFEETGGVCIYPELPLVIDIPEEERMRIRNRLLQYGLIDSENQFLICISNMGLEFLHELENPPPEDHWKNIRVWFFSKWWSLPVLLFVVVLPLIVTWIGMIKTVLEWVGLD